MAVKERVGLVVSDKMQKTVVVAVENRAPHPKYGKIVVQTRRYKAHDENNDCKIGDRVRIQETRPLSKTKRWQVTEVLNKENANQPKKQDQPVVEPSSVEAVTEQSVAEQPVAEQPTVNE